MLNPSFSALALGFDRGDERVDLSSPEMTFAKFTRAANKPDAEEAPGTHVNQGWRIWCILFSISQHKTILSQETIEKITLEETG